MRRGTTFVIGVAALFVLAVAVISSSRAIAQRADGSNPNGFGDDGSSRVDILAAVGGSAVPTFSCPPCSIPVELSEDFDNVMPPALPPDWIATNAQGPPPLWVISDSGVPAPPADTLPNAAFIDDPAVVSDKRLDWGPFNAGLEQFTFRHNFNLEASNADPNVGFDGGVLEISFDGGNTFQDIRDAGGEFLEGGYNRTIAMDRRSPIAGRRAWSGNSQGFITTVVSAPVFFSNGVLRWRMASDNTGSGEGWRIDTVNITWCKPIPSDGGATSPCGPTPTPPITPTPSTTVTPTVTPTLTPTPTATPTPTPTPTPSEAPCSVIGTEPPCGSTVSTQPSDFVVDMSAPVDPESLQASDFMCNGIPANSVSYPGSGTITFHFNASPVAQGDNTMVIPAGAFDCAGSRQGVDGLSCTFTYQASTPTPTLTPRPTPTPRPRPTPLPRP